MIEMYVLSGVIFCLIVTIVIQQILCYRQISELTQKVMAKNYTEYINNKVLVEKAVKSKPSIVNEERTMVKL